MELSMVSLSPYGRIRLDGGRTAWGVFGLGRGQLALAPATGPAIGTDIGWAMAAAGMTGELVRVPAGGGFGLTAKSDVLWTRTASERATGLLGSQADVTRFRAGLEGSWDRRFEGGAILAPKLEVGARHDGGDAETGWGVELGAEVEWKDAVRGIGLMAGTRGLVRHEDGDFGSRGYSASFEWDPSPGTDRGPSLSLRQEYGASPPEVIESLFGAGPLAADEGPGGHDRKWTLEAAYGRPALGGRYTGSPRVGLGFSPSGREWTLGWRLAPAGGSVPDISFDITAAGTGSEGQGLRHRVGIEINARW